MHEVDWLTGIELDKDASILFKEFFEIFSNIYDYAFPSQFYKNRPKPKRKEWITQEIIELSKLVKEMSAINKRIDNAMYNERYLALRKFYRERLKQAKKSYNDKRLLAASNICKTSWNIINENRHVQKKASKIGSISDPFSENNKVCLTETKEICETFNKYFISVVGDQAENLHFSAAGYTTGSFFLFPTSPEEIFRVINTICNKRSSGVDEIPGTILTEVANITSYPLSIIINCSFNQGIYPSMLKESKIVPIYKGTGDKNDVKNYRPVALQCHFAKIYEYCFNQRLTTYLEKNNLLSKYQNGFRAERSTESALNMAVDHIYQALNDKKMVLGLFFDMTRAFDTSINFYYIRCLGMESAGHHLTG